jgi:hypothetical protein
MESRSKQEDHNTSYTVRVKDPLIRPGMEIEAGPVSEQYLVPTVQKLMDAVREVNSKDD